LPIVIYEHNRKRRYCK